jgi:hypothetical protein
MTDSPENNNTLSQMDYHTLTRQSSARVELGDLYIYKDSVYRVAMYNETSGLIQMATTNNLIFDYAWMHINELDNFGFYLCPLSLRSSAIQIFELDEEVSQKSKEALLSYRMQNITKYIKLRIPELLPEVEYHLTRSYPVPAEQAKEFPHLDGVTFTLPILFYCLTEREADKRYRMFIRNGVNDPDYVKWKKQADKTLWPLLFIPDPNRSTVE